MIKLKSEYLIALKAAVEAAEKIMEIYVFGFDTEYKIDGSPVTKADIASSDIIDSYLETTGIPITGEETVEIAYSIRKEWIESWCVDPLDGTKEFVKRNGEFAVNIALIRNEKAVFGLIASPVNKMILFGGEEIGVYLFEFKNLHNQDLWEKIELPAKINDPLVIACSRSHQTGPILEFIEELKKSNSEIDFIKKGSALKFFDLALGLADAYPRFAPTMEWDIAAGQAIMEALGGSVINIETNKPLTYNKEDLTNPHFIAKTNALLKNQ